MLLYLILLFIFRYYIMSTFEIKSEIYGEKNYETVKLDDGSECNDKIIKFI